jgi:ethanolamine ammonia-lyase small subunit
MADPVLADPWRELRRYTQARIALGRAGASLPTRALLDFGLAHAQARDAVRAALELAPTSEHLRALGWEPVAVRSAASDRELYLRRPDLGRRLDAESATRLKAMAAAPPPDVAFVIGDGLSAQAAQRHAPGVLAALRAGLATWRVAPVVLAQEARVALGDEIGALLGAVQVVVLIGERPGLSSHDSLGIYLTHDPRLGRRDAERNCISNVRPQGLSYEAAAARLLSLMHGARRLGCSGVALKDESGADAALAPPLSAPASGWRG